MRLALISLTTLLHCLQPFLLQSATAASTPDDRQPNVIIVMTDDQGYGDFGATGNTVIQTPFIDQMARQSASWQEFYVSPVCSPTRACLMTGRYNHRTKCIDTFKGRSMMAADEVTLAEVLAENGYATGIFGKWHLGDNYPMRPTDQGFDQALVHKGGGLAQPSEPVENRSRYTDPLLFLNNREVATTGYCTDVFFDAALDFISDYSDSEQPFFAYVPLNAPHGPFGDVPENWYKRYRDTDFLPILPDRESVGADLQDRLARISAMISNVDENVGRLFARLEQLEITEDTLVIFLVDNGPNSDRFVGPFRGRKSQMYEGGIRSPIWFHMPGTLDADSIATTNVAAHIDIMPTVLDACGITEVPDGLDGRSMWPKLVDPAFEMPERPLVIQYHRGDVPVRNHSCMVRLGTWKLVHPSGTQKEVFEGEPAWELYDLSADPGESNDVINENPAIAARLEEIYGRWFDDVVSTRADQIGPPPIVIDPGFENPSILTWQDIIDGSWRGDQIGYFKLEVASPGRYDIRFEARPGTDESEYAGATAKLQLGDTVHETSYDAASRSAIFRAVDLPQGPVRLTPWIETTAGKQASIYHVWISPR
ncbi:MAG: arylsulfatase [Planctomycetota bacterium]